MSEIILLYCKLRANGQTAVRIKSIHHGDVSLNDLGQPSRDLSLLPTSHQRSTIRCNVVLRCMTLSALQWIPLLAKRQGLAWASKRGASESKA